MQASPAIEAHSGTAMGQLMRKGVAEDACPKCGAVLSEADVAARYCEACASALPRESVCHVKHDLTVFTHLREAAGGSPGGPPRVVLISAGPGNTAHGNFYPPEILARDAKNFEGVKSFLDHPGRLEETNRPEREVEAVGGWLSNVAAIEIDGETSLVSDFNYMRQLDDQPTETGLKAKGLIESAIVYARQYPGSEKVLLGFSINANGPTHRENTEDLIRRYPRYAEGLRRRPWWNVSDGIEAVQSVDIVTFPARGGRVLGLREAEACFDSRCWRQRFESDLQEAA